MSFIMELKSSIYDLLSKNHEIASSLDKIYLSPVTEAKHPFLLINIAKLKNRSTQSCRIYEAEFELSVFSRAKGQTFLSSVTDNIIELFASTKPKTKHYLTAGINLDSVSFELSKDLVTNKATIFYKSLFKQE